MDNVKDDAYYVRKITDDLAFISRHMKDVDIKAFSDNEILQDSMVFRLIQISENARRLTDEYREKHAVIPWTAISGLRNRLVHDYGNVDFSIVYDTLKNDISALMNVIESGLSK